jgi:hypothetical protein
MQMTTLLFVTAALTGSQQAQPPVAPAPTIRANFNATAPDAPQQGREPGRPIIEERPHTVGLGSALTASNHGIGGATRVFFNDRIGVDFSANWYRPNSRYSNSTGSIFHATPSFLYMLTRPDDMRDVDIRPYVGGGLSYVNSSYRSALVPETTGQRTSGIGGQAFGGAEITFKAAQWVTISFEGRYYRLPVRFVNTNMIGGMNYLMMFHFFVN